MYIHTDSTGIKDYVADSKAEAKVANELAEAVRNATRHAKDVAGAARRVANLAGSLSTIDAQSVNSYAERLTEDLARRDAYLDLMMEEFGSDRAAILALCEDAADGDSFVFVITADRLNQAATGS